MVTLAFAFTGMMCAQTIYSFQSSTEDNPRGSLISDASGNLYGTTAGDDFQAGTVFELSPPTSTNKRWTKTTLYSFPGYTGDGFGPVARVFFDEVGNLYGTTFGGGTHGAGTVFELSPPSSEGGPWTETLLYSFGAFHTDGGAPGGIMLARDGSLYGTTRAGGPTYGTVFQLKPNSHGTWTERILYRFSGGSDGAFPIFNDSDPLLADLSGNLYGTSSDFGFAGNFGVVFELSPPPVAGQPWTFTVLHTFNGASGDGKMPYGGLISDAAGNLYGTTTHGGSSDQGTVFELSPAPGGIWTETILYSFTGTGGDGKDPGAALILDSAGNLYSTTSLGGVHQKGTVFQLAPPENGGDTWTETVLHSFGSTANDGSVPVGSVILRRGFLFGTTQSGGSPGCQFTSSGCGAVFEIAP
jgi:uncharacterized repeat protein (TIGR03803 family)